MTHLEQSQKYPFRFAENEKKSEIFLLGCCIVINLYLYSSSRVLSECVKFKKKKAMKCIVFKFGWYLCLYKFSRFQNSFSLSFYNKNLNTKLQQFCLML